MDGKCVDMSPTQELRRRYACAAVMGILANGNYRFEPATSAVGAAREAFLVADAMMEIENRRISVGGKTAREMVVEVAID